MATSMLQRTTKGHADGVSRDARCRGSGVWPALVRSDAAVGRGAKRTRGRRIGPASILSAGRATPTQREQEQRREHQPRRQSPPTAATAARAASRPAPAARPGARASATAIRRERARRGALVSWRAVTRGRKGEEGGTARASAAAGTPAPSPPPCSRSRSPIRPMACAVRCRRRRAARHGGDQVEPPRRHGGGLPCKTPHIVDARPRATPAPD